METVCNTYVVSSGVPEKWRQHAHSALSLACDFSKCLNGMTWQSGKRVSWKIGINSGGIVAGIAGRSCPRYRLFGDTINTASRMCSISANLTITVSTAHVCCLSNYDCPPAEAAEWQVDRRSDAEAEMGAGGDGDVRDGVELLAWAAKMKGKLSVLEEVLQVRESKVSFVVCV